MSSLSACIDDALAAEADERPLFFGALMVKLFGLRRGERSEEESSGENVYRREGEKRIERDIGIPTQSETKAKRGKSGVLLGKKLGYAGQRHNRRQTWRGQKPGIAGANSNYR